MFLNDCAAWFTPLVLLHKLYIMKQLIIVLVSVCITATIQAQRTNSIMQPKINKINNQPVTPPVLTDADYFLSVVTATIKTGNDNKEYPSQLSMYAYCGNMLANNHHGFLLYGYKNELKKNSTIPLVIGQIATARKYNANENSLAAYRQYGLKFYLGYSVNFQLDAWKIESLSLTLEFKDAKGNPHPTMGHKVVTFYDANLWMDGYDKQVAFYKTDQYFNALPVSQSSYKNFSYSW